MSGTPPPLTLSEEFSDLKGGSMARQGQARGLEGPLLTRGWAHLLPGPVLDLGAGGP